MADGEANANANPTVADIIHMSKKGKKSERKGKEKNYDIVHKAKQLWEQVRQKTLGPEKKKQVLDELFSLVKGKVLAVCASS